MLAIIKEFLGIGGYTREPEGYLSWQHLVFVTSLMIIMVILATVAGKKQRNKLIKEKNKPLIAAALVMDISEILKIVFLCFINNDPLRWIYDLPLFLCSIQMITIPVAAFSKGRLKDICLDFIFVFGLLGAILGTYAAGNNYAAYPVISLQNVVSGITHSTAGFAALYVAISGMISMKKKNIISTCAILTVFCVAAYTVNCFTDCNYMFMMRGDGTPYDILYNLVGGNPVLYPVLVVLLFFIYIIAFYSVYYLIAKRVKK
ncbi:MAG: YwaF family protein [Clostridia bacterium]|nr:YwaF family protein [Clostridia bacterium]